MSRKKASYRTRRQKWRVASSAVRLSRGSWKSTELSRFVLRLTNHREDEAKAKAKGDRSLQKTKCSNSQIILYSCLYFLPFLYSPNNILYIRLYIYIYMYLYTYFSEEEFYFHLSFDCFDLTNRYRVKEITKTNNMNCWIFLILY